MNPKSIIRIFDLKVPYEVSLTVGKTSLIKQAAYLQFTIEQNQKMDWIFLVIEGLNESIILGVHFMLYHRMRIKLDRGIVKLRPCFTQKTTTFAAYKRVQRVSKIAYAVELISQVQQLQANIGSSPTPLCTTISLCMAVQTISQPVSDYPNYATVSTEEYYNIDLQLNTKLQEAVGDSIISLQQANEALNVLRRYISVFRKELGQYNGPPVHLDISPSERWIPKHYPVPKCYKVKVAQEIDTWLELGICKKSSTRYINSIVAVPKKYSDKIRLCIDASALNNILRMQHHNPPCIENILFEEVSNNSLISTLYFRNGFLQLLLDSVSQELLGFEYEGTIYTMLRLPFGCFQCRCKGCSLPEWGRPCIREALY